MGLFDLKQLNERKIRSFFERKEGNSKKVKILFDSFGDLIIFIDKKGKILDINDMFLKTTSLKKEEIINKNLFELDLMRNKDLITIKKGIEEGNKKSIKETFINAKNKIIYVDISIVGVKKEDKVIGNLIVMRDITKRKEMEERIKELKEEYELLFNSSNDSIIYLDTKFKIIRENKKAKRTFGKGEKLSDIIGLKLMKKIKEIVNASDKKSNSIEAKIKGKDGKERIYDISIIKIVKDNEERGIQIVLRDITQKKRMEEKEKKMEEERRIQNIRTTFLMRISDELRQPLVPLLGYTSMVEESCKRPTTKLYIEKILANAKKLQWLIDRLIEIAHFEAGDIRLNYSNVDIDKLIADIVKDYKYEIKRKGLKVEEEYNANTKIVADSNRLKNAIRDVIDNAIKYTEKGKIFISTNINKNKLIIKIVDTGVGIKPSDAKAIERYLFDSSGKDALQKGLKLGLILAKMIVEAHKGKISIKRNKGKGTTVEITIPTSQ